MIKLTLDEGYCYDFLSIARVKMVKNDTKQNAMNFGRAYADIEEQVGKEVHARVLASEEYARLYAVNEYLFRLVDQAKVDSVKASDVDREVYNRWLAKKALQEKFFPDKPFQENKIGYVTK